MCDEERSHCKPVELMSIPNQAKVHHQSMLKMTTTAIDGQEELDVAIKVKTSPVDGQIEPRASRRRSKRSQNNRMAGHDDALRSLVRRLFSWSVRAMTFNLRVVIAIILLASSQATLNIKCDDDMQQSDVYSNQQQQNQQQQQQQVELLDLIKQQQNPRDPRGIFNLDELLSTQGSSSSLSYNLINPNNEPPMAYNNQPSQDQQQQTGASDSSDNQDAQQQQHQQLMQEQRANDLIESDQLETAQTSARGNSIASSASASTAIKSNDSSEKTADAAPAQSSGTASPSPSTGSSSSTASSLTDHLSAVNNLLHQAGQIGLSAAQQNVALSEAIINSVTNSLVGNNRKQNAQQAQAAQVQVQQSARPTNVVGQSIDGNIDYNPNTNTLDGFINFPGLNGSKLSLSGAMRPLLLAALKTVPIKFGSVGWKLLKLLAWKKIYKAHHPKSGEIIIEQEMKHGGQSGGSEISDKGGKLGKISDHFENKFKTSKMGSSYSGGNDNDWPSMMRTPGLGGDMFSNGWPHGDSHAASASMIYQRHLLPPGATNPLIGGGASQQQAAAAAAAAAATAAAIQSHWHQQQQQQLMADETSDNQHSRSNQTSGSSQGGSGGGQAGALRRKKATYGGSNWFAANPAHTYAAAAAAANAAAAMASQHQHQQQQQQRLANIMRAYELGGQSSTDHMGGASHGGNMHHALATGLMYQSLFDNAAAMAVQNTVRLPGMDHHTHNQNPLANAEFLDQSDTLSGSSFDSFASGGGGSGTESLHDSNPLTLMQRHDLEGNFAAGSQPIGISHLVGRKPSTDSMLTLNDQLSSGLPISPQLGPHRSSSVLDNMPEFDDTPAGKLISHALNESTPIYPGHNRFIQHRPNFRWT